MKIEWYHVAGAALAWWLWRKHEEQIAALGVELTVAQAGREDAERSAQADIDAEHRAAVAARAEIAKRDAALAAQAAITTETVGAVAGTVRAVLPPETNAPPKVVTNPPMAAAGEKVLARDANTGDTRIVPKEGSLSIARDTTYGATPTVSTEQAGMRLPGKKNSSLVVPEYLDDLRSTRSS